MAYDPRAVKVPKSIKRFAANEVDPHRRGAILRSYVKILEADLRSNKRSSKDNK